LIWKCGACCCIPPVAGTTITPGIGGSPASSTARIARPQPSASTDPVRNALRDGAGTQKIADNGQAAYEARLAAAWKTK
jgi:hypothetical protein